MKLSKYTKIFPCKEKGEYLIYSTRKTSFVHVPESTMKSIKAGNLSPSDEETLVKKGMLLPEEKNEQEAILGFFDKINKKSKSFNAVVVMNLDCTLDCKYCYEAKMRGDHYMSSETADLLIDYTEKHYLSEEKEVHIGFYGGEPLLSFEMIKYISKKIKTLTEKKGIDYSFSLVTNGTLLTGQRAEELAELGLKSARITIDGPKDNHNRSRPFKSGSGSFDCIIQNIREACDFIKIQIGGNFTRKNYRDFPLLLDYLLENGLTPDKISVVKFDPVAKMGKKSEFTENTEGCETANEPWLFKAGLFLREEILKRGFRTPKLTPIICAVELSNELVVNYDGTIYKCPAFLGWEDYKVGNLRIGIQDYSKSYDLNFWRTSPGCLDCEYLPLCFGGCRYTTCLKDGNIDGVDCRKPYFDATLETFIKQDIKYTL